MPHYYYTFSKKIDAHSSVQFFALDTDVIIRQGEYDLEQIEWLERELQASAATWKVVYGHHPVFSYGKHGHEKRMIELVRPLLEKYEVDFYICGHDHDRQLLGPVNNVCYIVSGTGSKSRDTRYGELTIFAETNLGFTWFRVSAGEFHVQFINADGNVEYAHTWAGSVVPKRPERNTEPLMTRNDE
jgi:3',5'-cyclic AMP phosphodiesterase CpdA